MKKTAAITMALLLTATAFAQDWTWAKKDASGFVTVDATKVKGDVLTTGSSTVFPMAQLVIDQFKSEGYKSQLSIDNIGSGAGLKRFANNEVDFANSSSKINADQKKAIVDGGVKGNLLEFKLAVDAVVILVNSKNTFLKNVTLDQAKALFSTATNYNEIDPSYPAQKIVRMIPETSHGTFLYVAEKLYAKKSEALTGAPNTQRFQDYNQLIANVSKDPNAVGFIGMDYFEQATGANPVSLDGVAPSKASALDGTYGLSRYLYTYTTDTILQTKPAAAAWAAFFLNNASKAAQKVFFFPLPKADLDAQKKLLADTVKGKF
jgi:phosphate transport system substrate-binding protein